jgi:ABC-type proline/glycine betaine transport system ATPase subunit
MLEPDILLLDEPFSAVDPVTRLGLYERFEEVQRARPVSTLLVTHDIREARRLADFLVVLKQGQIIQSGAPDGVFANPATPYVERLIASVA